MDFNNFVNENLWELKPITEEDNFIFNSNNKQVQPIDSRKIERILKSGYDIVYIQNPNFRRWKDDYNIPFETLREQLKKLLMNRKGNTLIVNPHIPLTDGIGRAIYNKQNISALAMLPKNIRNYLTIDEWTDFDMRNAHSTILLNICEKMGIDEHYYTGVKYYCENRDNVLKKGIMNHFNLTEDEYNSITDEERNNYKDEIKTLIIRVGYGGSYEYWCKENGLVYKPIKEIQDYASSFDAINNRYIIPNNKTYFNKLTKDYNRKLSTDRNKNKKVIEDVNKPKRTIISNFLQHYETLITGCICSYFLTNKKITNNKYSYEFDGFESRNTDVNKYKITPELITRLTKDLTDFDIQWTIKEKVDVITPDIELLEQVKQEKSNFPPQYLNYLDSDYFKSLKSEGYGRMKDYFEYFVKFSERPSPLFYIIENLPKKKRETNTTTTIFVRTVNLYEEHQLRKLYGRFGCGEMKKSGDEIKFLDKYLNDEDRITYKNISFEPYNAPYQDNYLDDFDLNTFTGYNNIVFNKTPFPKDIRKKILKEFYILGAGLVGGIENFKTLLYCFAHKIKEPTKQFPYGIIIQGSEGTGKNMILDCFGRIIGKDHYISTANVDDILGKHSEGLYHKLICNLNEMDLNQSKDRQNRFKAIISEQTLIMSPKHIRDFETENYALIIITSNESMPIPLDVMSGDRRWIVYNGYDVNSKKYNEKKWGQLASYFKTDNFIRALYEELCDYDIHSFDYKKAKKDNSMTKEYRRLAQYSIPVEINFLNDYINFNGWYRDFILTNGETPQNDIYFGWDTLPSIDFYSLPNFYNNIRIKCKTIMDTFNEWADTTKYKLSGTEKSQKAFNNRFTSGLKLRSIELVTECKTTYFEINIFDLIRELHSKNFYSLIGNEEWLIQHKSKTIEEPDFELDLFEFIEEPKPKSKPKSKSKSKSKIKLVIDDDDEGIDSGADVGSGYDDITDEE